LDLAVFLEFFAAWVFEIEIEIVFRI